MNKKIIFILIIIALGVGFYLSRKPSVKSNSPQASQQSNLPKDWQKVDDKTVEVKLVKTVSSGYKPQAVLVKSTSKEALNPAKFVDSLVAGAKSTIPSLKVIEDKRFSEEGKYSALMTGFYYNKNLKISLIQRIIIKGENVSTYTASFTGDISSEINSVLDTL